MARQTPYRSQTTVFQAFPLDEIRHIRIELGNAPSGRIAVWTAAPQESLSMFFDARSLDRAHELLDTARPLIARSRRGRPDGPARPPIGPAQPGSDEPKESDEPPREG
jgi:hypothetical protein